MNIIIVDDEKLIRKGLSFIISKFDSDEKIVGVFSNGREALDFCRSTDLTIDVVITDVLMPEMNGLELIEELKMSHPHIQTVVLSGYSEFKYAQQALRLGATDYMLKPVDKTEIKKVLEKIKRKLTAQNYNTLEDRFMIADNLVNRLLRGGVGFSQECHHFFKKYYDDAVKDHLFIGAGISIDRLPDSEWNQADLSLYQYFIRKLAEELIFENKNVKGFTVQDKSGAVTAIFVVPLGSEHHSLIKTKLIELLNEATKHIHYPITIGLSNPVDQFSEFPRMNEQIQAALKARLSIGTNKIIEYEECLHLSNHSDLHHTAYSDIIMALNTADLIHLSNSVTSFCNTLYKARVSPEQFHSFLLKLFYHVSRYLEEIDIPTMEIKQLMWEKLKTIIERSTTQELMKKNIIALLSNIMDNIQSYRSNKKPKYILDAVEYIHLHFQSDITLYEVADTVDMYPTYFSEQFKYYMGESFIDYVTKVRIEHAKKILKETNMPISMICEKIGYSTPAYFTKVFKKWTGSTPSQYRVIATKPASIPYRADA